MKKLLKYMRDYRRDSILGPFFKLLEASFELLVPLVVAAIIDIGIGGGDKAYVIKMCLLIAALAVVGMVSSVTAQFFAARAAVGFAKKVRSALFAHIQSFSFSQIDTLGTSTIITRLTNDMNQLQTGVNLFLRLALRSPFIVFGAMFMAFTIDVRSALIFAVAIVLLSVVVFSVMLFTIPLYKRSQSKLDRVLESVKDNLSGVRVIRAFRLEGHENEEFIRRNNALTQIQKFAGRISALMNPATYVIVNTAIIFLLWNGAGRVDSGTLSQGQLVALYNLMSQILVELIKTASLVITMTRASASARRIQDVLDISPSQSFPESSAQKDETDMMVEFRNVSLRYENAGDNTLSDISFKVKKGDVIGIIGGTGAGKSSLVYLLPRFYDATGGEILIEGLNIKDYSLEDIRNKVGIVFQKSVLFRGSIRENMLWGRKNTSDEDILKALCLAQAEDIVKSKGGLDFLIEEGGSNLSGGQRQRLTIARALVKQPDILILDDSSSALDFATDAALRKALREISHKTTLFIVSQRTSSVQNANKIIVLDNGRAVGIGTAEELLSTNEIYKEIHDSQFRKEGRHKNV